MNKQGLITPSGFADMMTRGRGKDADWGKTALAYAQRVALERLGVEIPEINSWALEHGNLYEPVAIEAYEDKLGVVVIQPQPLVHPTLSFVGGTPDGLIGDDGLLEVKCPYNPANHLANLTNNEQLDQYKWQIQGYLWITGRNWCDFVSYSPHFPDALKLHVYRIERDEEMISQLEERCVAFNQIVVKLLEGLPSWQ